MDAGGRSAIASWFDLQLGSVIIFPRASCARHVQAAQCLHPPSWSAFPRASCLSRLWTPGAPVCPVLWPCPAVLLLRECWSCRVSISDLPWFPSPALAPLRHPLHLSELGSWAHSYWWASPKLEGSRRASSSGQSSASGWCFQILLMRVPSPSVALRLCFRTEFTVVIMR